MSTSTNRSGRTLTAPSGSHPSECDQPPKDTQWLFPEYNFATVDVERHAGVIMERILERGAWDQIKWLFVHYGERRVAEWVRQHGFRLLSKRSFALWRLTLGVEQYVAPEWAIQAKKNEMW
jgi:hypothetical protein